MRNIPIPVDTSRLTFVCVTPPRPRLVNQDTGEIKTDKHGRTCVSLLLALDAPPHTVRDIVGHSDIEVTMTIYAHTSVEDKRAALRKLGEALD
jgi:integrase